MGIGRGRPGTRRTVGGASPVGTRPLDRIGMARPPAGARRPYPGGRGGGDAVRLRPLQANRRGGRDHHAGDPTRSSSAGSGAHAGRIRLSAAVAGRGLDGLPRGRGGQRPRPDAVRGLRVRPGRDPPQLLPKPIRTRTRACHEEGACRRPRHARCTAIQVRRVASIGPAIGRFHARMIGRPLPFGKHADGPPPIRIMGQCGRKTVAGHGCPVPSRNRGCAPPLVRPPRATGQRIGTISALRVPDGNRCRRPMGAARPSGTMPTHESGRVPPMPGTDGRSGTPCAGTGPCRARVVPAYSAPIALKCGQQGNPNDRTDAGPARQLHPTARAVPSRLRHNAEPGRPARGTRRPDGATGRNLRYRRNRGRLPTEHVPSGHGAGQTAEPRRPPDAAVRRTGHGNRTRTVRSGLCMKLP